MKTIKLFIALFFMTAISLQVKAQQDAHPPILRYQMATPRKAPGDATPVTLVYTADKISSKEAVLAITFKINKGWHIYSQKVNKGGPVKTSITFQPSKSYALIGTTTEPKPIISQDKTFNMEVAYFENTVKFKQKIKLNDKAVTIKGVLEYMAGKGNEKLQPVSSEFTIVVM